MGDLVLGNTYGMQPCEVEPSFTEGADGRDVSSPRRKYVKIGGKLFRRSVAYIAVCSCIVIAIVAVTVCLIAQVDELSENLFTIGPEHLYYGKFKILAFSDIHGRVEENKIKVADNFEDFLSSRLAQELQRGSASVLIYVGDMSLAARVKGQPCSPCTPDNEKEIERFANWMGRLPTEQYPCKILIPGNHDACLDTMKGTASVRKRLEAVFVKNGIHYLGGGEDRWGRITVVAHSGSRQQGLNILGMGISEARSLGCTGAFQHPPPHKPKKLSEHFQNKETECGRNCSQERYVSEYNKVLATLEKASNPMPVDILVMHGPPDNAGAKFQKAPGGKLVELIQKIKPSLFIVGHIHGDDRQTGLGEPYQLGGVALYNVATKNKLPGEREDEPLFDVVPPEWYL